MKDHYVPHCLKENGPKKNMEKVETKEEGKQNSSDADRVRQLPPGMKIKKKVPVEEQSSPKSNDGDKMTDKAQDKPRENHAEQENAEKSLSASSIKAASPKKTNQTSEDPCSVEQSKPTKTECVSKSSPSGGTQASSDTGNSKQPTSDKLTQSTESGQTKNHQDDEDVVLVSVKPATQKVIPPASTIQKTLTTFPGFQPASKANLQQENPKGLYNLFTTQLQQKKVSR